MDLNNIKKILGEKTKWQSFIEDCRRFGYINIYSNEFEFNGELEEEITLFDVTNRRMIYANSCDEMKNISRATLYGKIIAKENINKEVIKNMAGEYNSLSFLNNETIDFSCDIRNGLESVTEELDKNFWSEMLWVLSPSINLNNNNELSNSDNIDMDKKLMINSIVNKTINKELERSRKLRNYQIFENDYSMKDTYKNMSWEEFIDICHHKGFEERKTKDFFYNDNLEEEILLCNDNLNLMIYAYSTNNKEKISVVDLYGRISPINDNEDIIRTLMGYNFSVKSFDNKMIIDFRLDGRKLLFNRIEQLKESFKLIKNSSIEENPYLDLRNSYEKDIEYYIETEDEERVIKSEEGFQKVLKS